MDVLGHQYFCQLDCGHLETPEYCTHKSGTLQNSSPGPETLALSIYQNVILYHDFRWLPTRHFFHNGDLELRSKSASPEAQKGSFTPSKPH